MIPELLAIFLLAASLAGTVYGGRLWLFGYWTHQHLFGLALFIVSLAALVSFVDYLLS